MPRLKLNVRSPLTNWTRVPNYLIQTVMPTLSDTELRILLIMLRQTVGWNRPDRTIVVPYRKLMVWTGRSSETVWKAVHSLAAKGLIHTSRVKAYRESKQDVSESDTQQYTDSK